MPHYFSFSSHTYRRCSSLLGIISLGITIPLSGQANHTIVVRGLNYAFEAPDTVPAGLTTFILHNQGSVRHELVVARLKEGHTLSDVIAAKTPEERQPHYEAIVGIIVAQPGQRAPGSLVTELVRSGHYVLICNLRDTRDKPTHLMQGMGRVLHVRQQLWPDDDALNDQLATPGNLVCELPPNKRLLLPGRERLRRRAISLMELDCGGYGTPRSRTASRQAHRTQIVLSDSTGSDDLEDL